MTSLKKKRGKTKIPKKAKEETMKFSRTEWIFKKITKR